MNANEYIHYLSGYAINAKRSGDYQISSQIYELLNDYFPDDPNVFNSWAKTLACMGEYDSAISFFNKAAQFYQESARKEQCNGHINCLSKLNKNSNSFLEYMRSLSGNPDFELNNKNLSLTKPINTYEPDYRETIMFGGRVKYIGTGRIFTKGFEFESLSFRKNVMYVSLPFEYIETRSNYNIYRPKSNAESLDEPWVFGSETGNQYFYTSGRFFKRNEDSSITLEIIKLDNPVSKYIDIEPLTEEENIFGKEAFNKI